MKIIDRHNIHQFIFATLLLCIAGSLPYSIRINSLFIIFLTINWLVSGDLKNRIIRFYHNKYALIFVSLYFCYVAGLLYSENLSVGLQILENKISLLAFPLILTGYNISKKLLEKVLIIFVASCLTAVIISTLNLIINYPQFYNDAEFNYRETLISFLKYHPTYLSIYLYFSIFTIFYFLYNYRKNLKGYQKFFGIIIVIYFLLISLLLSARMPTLIFFLIITTILFVVLYKKITLGWSIFASILMFALFYAIYSIPAINQRFVEIVNTPLKPPVGIYHNSTNLRVGIMYCSFNLLKEHLLFGLGTGDMQKALNTCYQINGFSDELYITGYEPHNQFIEIWLNVGIIGFFILILNFILPIRLALRKKYLMYLSFLILVSCCCLTESLLNLQKGVVFYSLFNSLFLCYILQNETTIHENG